MKLARILQALFVIIITSWTLYLTFQLEGQPKVAYVHSAYLFENYLGTIESYKTLESKNEEWGNNLDSLSKTYRATFASYKAESEDLNKGKKEALGHQLHQQETVFNKYHAAVEKMKSEEDQKLTQSVIKQIDAYLKEYALNKGYDLIMGAGGTSSLVYGGENYDVTEEVLVFINKKYRGE